MMKNKIILLIIVIINAFCNAYDYPKPELKFDCEDAPLPKLKVIRGVFFYTYDDNFNDREVEMHELNLESFNKLVSSSDYVKSPAAVKSTFNFIEFFDGRCQASVNCERIPKECPSISPCSRVLKTTSEPLVTTTTKPLKITPTTTTTPSPPKNDIKQKMSKLFLNGAPQLTEPQLNDIMTAIKNINRYAQHWTPYQVHEIGTRNSLIHENEMLRQNTSINAVMKFSDEIKQQMINYTKEFDPNMTLEDILGMIEAVEEIGTATMRSMTFDQFKALRSSIVAEFVTNVEINGYVSTTLASRKPSTTTKAPTTSGRLLTTTTKRPATLAASTTTKKPQTTPKTYVPPPGSSRKQYTRWIGQTYRQFTGQYSFGYSWKPFTGGISWKSRAFTTGSTTTTERYGQKGLEKTFNPVGN